MDEWMVWVRMRMGIQTGYSAMLVKNNEVCDIVCSACLCKFFYNVISSINPMWIREYESHFLWFECEFLSKCNRFDIHTFVNCRSLEFGSRDVVITNFGSCILVREYSLSMCVVGSECASSKARSLPSFENIPKPPSLRLKNVLMKSLMHNEG